MGVLIKAFFAALLAFVVLLTVAEIYIPELGEMADMANAKRSSPYIE